MTMAGAERKANVVCGDCLHHVRSRVFGESTVKNRVKIHCHNGWYPSGRHGLRMYAIFMPM